MIGGTQGPNGKFEEQFPQNSVGHLLVDLGSCSPILPSKQYHIIKILLSSQYQNYLWMLWS